MDQASPGYASRLKQWVGGWSPVTKLCVAIILVAWLARMLAAATGWYIEDDFIFKYNAATEPMDLSYLFRSHYGNLMPGAMAVEWIRVRLISADFWSAALISGIAYMASSLLLLRLLRKWVTSATATVVAIVWFCVVLLSSETQFWWAAALNGGLMLPFALAAILIGCRYVYTPDRKYLIIGAILLIIALAMFEKAVSVGVWALLVMWVWRVLRRESTDAEKRRAWQAAGVAVGICAVYLALFILVFPGSGGDSRLSPAVVIISLSVTARSVLTSVFGGPWSWQINSGGIAVSDPSWWGILIAAEVLILIVCLSLWVRRRAWAAVLAAFAAFLTSSLLLLLGRIANPLDALGTDRGVSYRYSADLIAPFAIAGAVMFSAVVGETDAWRNSIAWVRSKLPSSVDGRRFVIFGVLNLLVVSSLVSWMGYVPAWASNKGGDWAQAASREINKLPIGQTLVNQPVPDTVLKRQVSSYSLAQAILTPYVPQERWTAQSSSLTVVDAYGFVGPGYVDGQHVAGPAPNCGWRLDTGKSVTVDLQIALEEHQWLIQLGYLSGANGAFSVQLGGNPATDIVIDRGLANVYTAVQGPGKTVVLTNQTSSTVCVSDLWIGTGRLTNPPVF